MASTIKSAKVYRRRDHYYVYPLAGSGGGDPVLLMEPVTQLAAAVDAAELGRCVQQCLQLSHHHAPRPTNWKTAAEPLFRAAGVKSEATFMKGAKSVRVDLEGGEVTIISTVSKGYPDGAVPLGEAKFRFGTSVELGEKVLQAMAISV